MEHIVAVVGHQRKHAKAKAEIKDHPCEQGMGAVQEPILNIWSSLITGFGPRHQNVFHDFSRLLVAMLPGRALEGITYKRI